MKIIVVFCLFVATMSVAFAQPYADESTDWGVKSRNDFVSSNYHSETPLTVPGAKTITTVELKKMLDSQNPPLVFDVLGGDVQKRFVVPDAILLGSTAGIGILSQAEKERFSKMLSTATGGDKNKPVVFYCLSSHCWLSYNASLRAVGEGYQNVLWYRGGFDAWKAAKYPFMAGSPYAW